jgi:serine/threonine-protein kinase
MPLSTGQVLNERYRIVALLAQGGFGAVYRAWDLNLKNPVALKENLSISAESIKQFTLEARLLANLRHENLPYVIDYFSLPDQGQYLVMEFIEGDDLQAMVDEAGGALPKTQVIAWMNQVCNALEYLHAQQPPVIHRDIKPANIKISKGGVKLVDFGIAKVYDPTGRTTVGARAVTQGYSPPEQYGSGRTDTRSDVYALGATLYTLLTGSTPLDSLQRQLGQPLTPPRQANPALSLAEEQVILQAMELEAGGRFQSVRAFKNALNAALAAPPIVQRPAQVVATMLAESLAPQPVSAAPAPAYSDQPRRAAPAPQAASHSPAPEFSYNSPYSAALPAAQPKGRNIGLMIGLGVLLCLGASVLAASLGYFLFYPQAERAASAATHTSTPLQKPDRPTATLAALVDTATLPPPEASPTFPSALDTPTPLPSWTPIPSLTPTATTTQTQVAVATWYPCAGSYPSRLKVGLRAYVSYDPPLPNRVRSQPNTTSNILGMLEVGEQMEILEGPVCSQGWIWWRISSMQKSLTGWTAEGDQNDYWLVPLP